MVLMEGGERTVKVLLGSEWFHYGRKESSLESGQQ